MAGFQLQPSRSATEDELLAKVAAAATYEQEANKSVAVQSRDRTAPDAMAGAGRPQK